MAESGSGRSSLSSSFSSVTDDECIYSSFDSLPSEENDNDFFLTGALSYETEAAVLPYRFEPEASPEPSTDDCHEGIVSDGEDMPSSRIGNTNW